MILYFFIVLSELSVHFVYWNLRFLKQFKKHSDKGWILMSIVELLSLLIELNFINQMFSLFLNMSILKIQFDSISTPQQLY